MGFWSAEALFFATAAIIQLALGAVIVWRRPKVEWAIVLGSLFVLNGLQSANSMLYLAGVYTGAGPGLVATGAWVAFLTDRSTTFLILFLALAYPRRPRLLAGRPWVLPTAFALALGSVVLLQARQVPIYASTTVAGCAAPCWQATAYGVWTNAILNVGFPVLLVRWAWLLPKTRSPVELQPFKLLFAAFAVRAAHVELLLGDMSRGESIFLNWPHWLDLPGNAFMAARSLLGVGAVVVAVLLLLRGRSQRPSEVLRAGDFVLAFVGIGLLLYLIGRGITMFGDAGGYFLGPLVNLDVYVIRVALVTYAMMNYQLFGPVQRNPRRVAALLGLLALVALAAGIEEIRNMEDPGAVVASSFAALVIVGIGFAVWRIARPYMQAAAVAGTATAEKAYLAVLEDAYRNRGAGQAPRLSLEPQRQRAGLDPLRAQQLEAAVQSRWTQASGGDWVPGERVLGRYDVGRLLGEGGAGEVHLARDIVAGQDVVLKRTRRLDPAVRRSMLHEAYALSKLEHPNVVRLLRTEKVGDEPLLVLEYMPGGSLKSRLERRRLTFPETHLLARQVLAGLESAHQAGIVHCDLKPSNILFDGQGRAKIADFGTARFHEGTGLVEHTETVASTRGTLRYQAPEQVRGEGASIQSDVYAVALILYECLAGGHPAPADWSDYQLRRWIVEGKVPAIPRKVPPGAAAALRRGMARNPRERYPDAPSFARALGITPETG